MPDQRLRELERRWREGDVAAGAAWLKARVRAGELTQARIDEAASLGDPAAAAASDVEPREPGPDWLAAVTALGGEAAFRAGLAAAWLVAPEWELALGENKRAPRVRHTLAAAEAWWTEPSLETSIPTSECMSRLQTAGARAWLDASLGTRAAWSATFAVARAVLQGPRTALSSAQDLGAEAIGAAVEVRSWEAVAAAVRADLAPWILDLHDPLRERVLERSRARVRAEGDLPTALVERLAAGELQRGALRLAAYVGHEAADAALRAAGELPAAIPDDLETWVLRSMAYGGLTAPVAMFLAIGRAFVEEGPALAATARWVGEPTPAHAAACLEAAAEAGPVARLVPAAVAAVGLEEHRERRSALARLLESLVGHAAAAGLDEAALRGVIRDTLGEVLLT